MDSRKISFCLTTYNRPELTIENIKNIYTDERISEFIIVDDYSNEQLYELLKWNVMALNTAFDVSFLNKIKLYRNEKNEGVYKNKKRSVELATNPFVIVADSDNKFDSKYIDKLYEKVWVSNIIYSPDFAKPYFNFKHLSDNSISKHNTKLYKGRRQIDCFYNLCNYFVCRETFLASFDETANPLGADSIYYNLCLLKQDNIIYVVKDMEYEHPISKDSNYNNFAKESEPLCNKYLKEIGELS